MSRRKLLGGYVYPSQESKMLTVEDWQQIMAAEIAKGGFRRYDKAVGETYIHQAPPNPRIVAEIYGNVPEPPKGDQDAPA